MATPKERETEILERFLLSRASLQDIISMNEFKELFPKEHRSHPQVRLLYREFQDLRKKQIRRVQRNIQLEVALGEERRGDVQRAAREAREQDPDAMEGIELFGAPPAQPNMSLKEMVEQMELANQRLQDERSMLDAECDQMMSEIKTIVGEMSDLRYGKKAPDSYEQVVAQLEHLEKTCETRLDGETQESDSS